MVAKGVVIVTSDRASLDTWPERNRKAPLTLNPILPRLPAGLKTNLSSVSVVFSPSVSRVLSLKVTSNRAAAPVDTISLRKTDALRPSARVAPSCTALASPCIRLFAEPSEKERTKRANGEAGGERKQREDESRRRVDPGKELRRENRRQRSV